jgi:hypothetical protein
LRLSERYSAGIRIVQQDFALSFFDSLRQDLEIVRNRGIFTLQVTVWMMPMQRLSVHGTLDSALTGLPGGNGRDLPEQCKRVREDNISANTGGYSKARQKMPEEAARRVAQRSFEQLHQIQSGSTLRDRLFMPDGSSIRLSHTPAIVKAYPPAGNAPAVRTPVGQQGSQRAGACRTFH